MVRLALPCLSIAAAAGIEPAVFSLTGRRLTVWLRRNRMIKAPDHGLAAVPGVEPGTIAAMVLPPWQGDQLASGQSVPGCRYIMGASGELNCQRTKSTGPESNRRYRMTNAARRCPVRSPCRWTTSACQRVAVFVVLGPEGLEPSPTWLRARHAATSTLIPFSYRFVSRAKLARRESDSRPVSYKDTAPTTELRASGVEGSRTLTFPLKRRKSTTGIHAVGAPVTPRPRSWSGCIRLSRVVRCIVAFPL